MRQEPNNEIDLLLRRLSRGQGERVADTRSDHLDADELSSYAENALPAAARLRYTEHLAECARCRELVVQLGAAAGVMLAEEPARISAPSGLRKFFASFFSPMVLRYAVPAMAVLVVAVIGLVVFRQNDSFMARRSVSGPGVSTQQAEPARPFSGGQDQTQLKHDAAVDTPQVRANKAKQPAASEETATTAAPVSTPIDETKKVAEAPKVENAQPAASEPAPPPAPKPSDSIAAGKRVEPQAQKDTEQARIAAAKEVDQQAKLQEGQRSEGAGTGSDRPGKDKAKVATRGVFGAAANEKARRDSDDNYVDDGETRSVAGRRFRKQRGIWIDTAYGGAATVNLTRGSEQYRALVADEPDIKTIAEQLDGQIIVVWKSRTYRIR